MSGVMEAVTARRFVCRACRRVHMAWAPRCSSCLSLEGLAVAAVESLEYVVTRPSTEPETEPKTELPETEPLPSPEPARPRLVVARAPDPDLEDPAEELADVASDEEPIPLSDVSETTFVRDATGLAPLDHVLGGGLVVASVVLLASPPGVGKTSLTLQMLDGLGHRCLYVTAEETREQIASTARRIGAASKKTYVLVERNLEKIFAHAHALRAQTIAIDSIQKMVCEDLDSRAGTPAQLKECTARLVSYAKTTKTALWLIGHVTGDGGIAGPKTIEHDVDVVLELEAGAGMEGNERILRIAGKNRHGPTNAIGRFELTAKGFVAVDGDGWDEEL
jgi:predicted ATP-dependent serine protease